MLIVLRVSYFYLVFCLLGTLAVSSQNLIQNPSFEQFLNCPEHLGNFDADVTLWSTPTQGSTDYFNACSGAMGTPENFNGSQPSDFGIGYAGFYLYAPDDYREYLQSELIEALEKGKTYRASFFVSLAERSDFAIKEFGLLFARDKLEIPIKTVLSKRLLYQQEGNDYNYMEIGYTNFYSDTRNWILVSTQFVAKGTERFMILGNFKNNASTRLFKTKRNAKQGAYYYVDMVSVKTAESAQQATRKEGGITDGKEPGFELDTTHIFENVLFAFDKFQLLEAAENELQSIHRYLLANPELQIVIKGHTDSIGAENYNKLLSANRCQAVADYFLHLGLEKQRISWEGYGSAKPIASNKTETGRKLNRRVAFVITRISQNR